MTNTENLNLNLIEEHDLLDFAPFNENANIIDAAIAALQTAAEAIPTMQSAIEGNTGDINDLEDNFTSLSGTVGNNSQAITDLQTVATNQGNRITELENKATNSLINSLAVDVVKEVNYIKTNLNHVQHPSGGYRLSLTIPLSELPQATNYKVTSAQAYNDGLVAAQFSGWTLINAGIQNNQLILNWYMQSVSGFDSWTAAVKILCYN